MKWSRGFTLVELLVSISIVTVMMGVGLPAFRNYGRKAELNQAATDIQVAILQAHNLALAPESDKPSGVNYYGVEFDTEKKSFDVIRGTQKPTESGCPVPPDSISLVEHHVLPAGITMPLPATSPVSDCVGYLVGTGATPANGNRRSITLKSSKIPDNSSNTNIQSIQINPVTGQVSIEQTVTP